MVFPSTISPRRIMSSASRSGTRRDLGDHLVVPVRVLLLPQVLREEEMDALVGEAGRREDGRRGGVSRSATQARLLAQLARRARLRRLARAGRGRRRAAPR